MPTHPTSTHPSSSRRDAEVLGCSPGGTLGWRQTGPMFTHPVSIHLTFSRGGVGWRQGTESIHPMFSRRYTRMERGPMLIHPLSIHSTLFVGGAGMQMGYHAHPPYFHPPGGKLGWRWGTTSARTLFSRTNVGNDTGHHIYYPKFSRRMLGWRGGLTSCGPTPFRRDPCADGVPHHSGRAVGWGHVPRRQAGMAGWTQDPPSALGNPTLIRDNPNCQGGGGGTSCFMAALSPLRAVQ